MDALKNSYQQFLNLFGSMSGSQRATLLVVPLMVVAAFGFLMLQFVRGAVVGKTVPHRRIGSGGADPD
jgi:hypothetical protein